MDFPKIELPTRQRTATFHPFKLCQRVMVDVSCEEDAIVESAEETSRIVVRNFEATLYRHRLVDRPLTFDREIEPPTLLDFILRRKRKIHIACIVKVDEVLTDHHAYEKDADGSISVAWMEVEPTITEFTEDRNGKIIQLDRSIIAKRG